MLNSTGSKFQTTERGCRIIYLSCFFIIQPRFLFGRSQSPPPASHSNLPPRPSFGEGDGVRPAPLVRKAVSSNDPRKGLVATQPEFRPKC